MHAVGHSADSPAIAATITLSRPLPTHKGDVRAIQLRKPTFGEFIEIGPVENLVFTNGDDDSRRMESRIDLQRLMKWAVRLSDIDQLVLSSLDPADGYALSKAVVEIVNVFVVGGNFKSPQTSSSSSAASTHGSSSNARLSA